MPNVWVCVISDIYTRFSLCNKKNKENWIHVTNQDTVYFYFWVCVLSGFCGWVLLEVFHDCMKKKNWASSSLGNSVRLWVCCCGDFLTLIIRERSPASASSRTMFSSLSSIKDAWYFITLGWFNCCGREEKKKRTEMCDRKKKRTEDMLVTLASMVTLPNPKVKSPWRTYRQWHLLTNLLYNLYQNNPIIW